MANEIIKGMGFHHIAVKAKNYEESMKFYTEGLGMKFMTQWGEGDERIAMLDMGNGDIVELFAGGNDKESVDPKYIHFAMCVDDVDAAYEAALKAGAKPKTAPLVAPLDSAPIKLTLNCAFVYGPAGEELEFFKILEQK
ncbi:MAG: VOC family protein [Ruminococcaceae bacterium]|nr:VOC family protein [Oscillospiraceae bacterium]